MTMPGYTANNALVRTGEPYRQRVWTGQAADGAGMVQAVTPQYRRGCLPPGLCLKASINCQLLPGQEHWCDILYACQTCGLVD